MEGKTVILYRHFYKVLHLRMYNKQFVYLVNKIMRRDNAVIIYVCAVHNCARDLARANIRMDFITV